jgi:peptidoglycan/xylan/chitin deacetylase (PgdA/CDA1 family)
MKFIRVVVLVALVLMLAGAGVRVFRRDKSTHVSSSVSAPLETPTPVQSVSETPSLAPQPLSTPKQIASGATHILMYHYIRSGVDKAKDPIGYGLSVSPRNFEAQLAAYKQAGYASLTMADFAAGKGGPKDLVLTFDDGYEDFYTTAWPLLKQYGYTATIYVISGKIGGDYMTWDQLRELKAAGIEVGAHTVNHIDLSKATEAVQHAEIFGSKATIDQKLGGGTVSFCYPSGKFNPMSKSLVKSAGYKTATTTHPGADSHSDDPYVLNRVRVNPDSTPEHLLGLLR